MTYRLHPCQWGQAVRALSQGQGQSLLVSTFEHHPHLVPLLLPVLLDPAPHAPSPRPRPIASGTVPNIE